jgi:acetyl esterase/lipase
VCLSIEYRVAPHHRWPRHLKDVKAAIAWARANVDRFGGDRDFVAIAGCSAGGHLAALAGLTADDPEFQSELAADADTSVDAVVGMYGRYDWADRSTPERARFMDFLERVVVKKRYDRHPDIFRAASPVHRLTPNAPPFFVVHGQDDSIIPVGEAREFVDAMREVSKAPVAYAELPHTQHGFDIFGSPRAQYTADAVGQFLSWVYATTRE